MRLHFNEPLVGKPLIKGGEGQEWRLAFISQVDGKITYLTLACTNGIFFTAPNSYLVMSTKDLQSQLQALLQSPKELAGVYCTLVVEEVPFGQRTQRLRIPLDAKGQVSVPEVPCS